MSARASISLADADAPSCARLKVQCPAKVNLFLEVTGRRRDGYHNLATLFAKVNLFDTLELESVAEPSIEFSLDNRTVAPLAASPDNLVVRAAAAFRKRFRVDHGFRIKLEKKIPIGAGLGGGSSDAAGTLVGLSRLTGKKLDRSHRFVLKTLARELGADAPFFLQEQGLARGEGIGDKLSPLMTTKSLPPMVLVYPRVAISTSSVYGRLSIPSKKSSLTRVSQLSRLQKKLSAGRPISEWAGLLFNRLEEPVLGSWAQVKQAKDILIRLGAQGALMSGSGSSVFGFFPEPGQAERAAERLKGYPWDVFVTFCF
ncbi:MAG: 4-(cytidine 5'-diphospho)-2-C-methyl-D-erythritol kinase [Elusimicrobia bacterium]|nr:4-(cytidine 5'-diphospho)-2-C-methyl-D-erythritol kinase [Elusimicrobiota bacterium]